MINELAKDVKNFEGLYQVTASGAVWSIRTGKFLKARPDRDGYMRYTLSKDGKLFTRFAHRLVAEAFIENVDGKPEVNHIDCNRANNKLENLEWVTHAENMEHRSKMHQKRKEEKEVA
ncbi:HNH endonuclease [Zhenhengia yiwuensis]|uniref:HNH endonuclease n=1 Tax=Zhenhengia yiwuensis TaxID=2763666 RepID=UPI002A74F667|nr:HNH endonuclease [Zhenhengia yiwuensis]MDY3368390.1 HNH endonuclease [Zhenhengia yiwuensis]